MKIVFFEGESDRPSIARFDGLDVPRKGEHVWLEGVRYFVEWLEWHPDRHEVHVRLTGVTLESDEGRHG